MTLKIRYPSTILEAVVTHFLLKLFCCNFILMSQENRTS